MSDPLNPLKQLAIDLPPLLGPEWGPGQVETRFGWKTIAIIPGPDGASLELRCFDDRISVQGVYLQKGYAYRNHPKPITVAMSRSAAVLAKEIQRRYLPDYLETYNDDVTRAKQREEYQAATRAAAEHLAEVLGIEPPEGARCYAAVKWGDVPGFPMTAYIKVDMTAGNYGDITITSAPLPLMERLAETVKKWKEEAT